MNNEFEMGVRTAGLIKLLKDNLVGRYKDCFCILQELLQNADDARSTHVHFGVTKALGTEFTLGAAEGFFIVNNGPVSRSNMQAIYDVAAGDKGDSEDKIGKFGLGMKSVFHVCEAFVMFGEGHDELSGFPYLCTPWLPPYHQDWHDSFDRAKTALAEEMRKRIPAEMLDRPWFCVWLPLRSAEMLGGVNPIIGTYPKLAVDDFTGIEYSSQLIRFLPLLKHVTEVSFGDLNGKITHFRLASIGDGRLLGREKCNPSHPMYGEVTCADDGSKGYSYIGTERILNDEELNKLRKSHYWPKYSRWDEKLGLLTAEGSKGEIKSYDEKVNQHVAVSVLTERSDKPTLSVVPCVFLPLSVVREKDHVKEYVRDIEGDSSVTIYLHGNFFISAARGNVTLEGNDGTVEPQDESQLCASWNAKLWSRGVLPMIIDEISKAMAGWSEATKASVITAFASLPFINRGNWINTICQSKGIVHELTADGYEWRVVSSNHEIISLDGKENLQNLICKSGLVRKVLCDSLSPNTHVVDPKAGRLVKPGVLRTELPEDVCRRVLEYIAEMPEEDSDNEVLRLFAQECAARLDFRLMPERLQEAMIWRVGTRRCSYRQLRELTEEHRLYCHAEGDLKKIFDSAVDWDSVQINEPLAKALKLNVPDFTERLVLDILQEKPQVGSAEMRRPLLDILLQKRSLHGEYEWFRACRYLVHGQARLFDNDDPIFLPIDGNGARFSSLIISTLAEQRLGVECSVDSKIVSLLSPQDCQSIGLCSLTPAELVIKLGEAADQVSYKDFPEGAWKKLVMLASMDEPGVRDALLKIPLFPTVKGELVALGNTCFWESEYKIHPILRDKVNILSPLGNDTACRRVRQLAQKWTDQTCYKQCRGLNSIELSAVLCDLLRNNAEITKDCRNYLVETKWLELKDGNFVAPSEIVAIPGITGIVPGPYYLTDVKDRECASLVSERGLLPVEIESLKLLFNFLALDARFKIGRLSNVRNTANALSSDTIKKVLRNHDTAPVLNVLEILDAQGLNYDCFLPRLCGEISGDRLVAIVNELSERIAGGTGMAWLWNYLIDYLEEASDREDFIDDILPKLVFLNAKSVVKQPSQLCTGGSSIPEDSIIHNRYLRSAKLTSSFVKSSGHRRADAHEREVSFKEYFAGWDSSLERQIGTFIICCSNRPEDVALIKERYGYEHDDIETVRAGIGKGDRAGNGDWLNGELEKQQINFRAVSTDAINVVAIDGSTSPIRLNGFDVADDLFYGQFNPHEVEYIQTMSGRNIVTTRWLKLSMRMPDNAELDSIGVSRLSVLLKRSTEAILAEYGKRWNNEGVPTGFYRHWERLLSGRQIEIAPTKAMILENAFGYLPSIGCKSSELKGPFNRWHNLFVAEAQAFDNDDAARVREHDHERNQIRRDLEQVILRSTALQKDILEAVRRKIRKGYSYSELSILFELFQNADDAAEELRELYGENKPDFVDRFIVKYDGSRLIVAHWGRMINQEKAGAIAGRRFDGFKRDLLKMLLISQSDKDQDEINVIGRFGLGFKTIHFVTNDPVVLSGSLRFRIIGGYLPEALTSDEDQQYKRIRDEISGDEKLFEPTIFCLPIIEDKQEIVRDVVDQFKVHAELLSIFARRIKTLEIKSDTGSILVRCEMERLKPGLNVFLCGSKHEYVLFRLRDADILLGWDNGSFAPLANDIPTVWATAPTRVKAGLGIAINANFDLDTGRGVLNDNSPDNLQLLESVAHELYDELVGLYNACDDEERGKLFTSLYRGLTDKSRRGNWRGDDAHALAACLRQILWRKGSGAYWRLIHDVKVVPACLGGDLECLCRLGEIEHFVDDRIAETELKCLIPPNKLGRGTTATFDLCRVGQIFDIEEVKGFIPKEKKYTVCNLLEDIRESYVSASPEWCAGEGARILLSSLSGADKVTVDELQQFAFKTRSGAVRIASELMIADEYEGLKAAFMPPEFILSDEYDEQGVKFAKMCRGEQRVKVGVLVAQAVATATLEGQIAVLKYLAIGNPSEEFKKTLRDMRQEGWLEDWANSLAARHLTQREKDRVADALSRNEEEYGQTMLDAWRGPDNIPLPEPPIPRPPISIPAVRDWWRIHAEEEIKDYNQELYGRDDAGELTFAMDLIENRKVWMELLVLGAAHSLGMRKCQHRGFIAELDRRGYWNVYCKRDLQASEWLYTIDDFLENEELNGGKYSYWMRLFFRIYQFSRNLDTYVQLFKSWNWAKKCEAPDLAAVKKNSTLSGSNIDVPGLQKALSLTGLHFVYREMVRRHAITNPLIHPQCFVPYETVAEVAWNIRVSSEIYRKIVAEIGERDATFGGAFDIALTQYDKHGREG